MARSGSYEAVARHARGCVLDLGCGDGYLMSLLPDAIGIDASASELRLASARGLRVVRGRAEQLPFADASFDVVTSHLAFMLMDATAAAREIDRVLRPGGSFVALVGGGPTAEGDDAFHRYLSLPRSSTPPLVDPLAKSEAGWRALFPGYAVTFERIVFDLAGTLEDVWDVLGASYQSVDRSAFEHACRDFGARVPLSMVCFVATARR